MSAAPLTSTVIQSSPMSQEEVMEGAAPMEEDSQEGAMEEGSQVTQEEQALPEALRDSKREAS